MHADALTASLAAQCAHEQGKFWEFHDQLFKNQRALKPDNLKSYAADLSLDTDKFNACVDTKKFSKDVNADHQAGLKVGVTGTPAFFVNGRFLSGAQPFEAFKTIIDEELAMNK